MIHNKDFKTASLDIIHYHGNARTCVA